MIEIAFESLSSNPALVSKAQIIISRIFIEGTDIGGAF
jgi:hypothetical protein